MGQYVEFLLLGLGSGSVFAGLALAIVVRYRSSGVLDFSSGAVALFGAYSYVQFSAGQVFDPIPGLPLGIDMGFTP